MKRSAIRWTLLMILMAASSVQAQTTRLKIATMAPDGSFWMNELEEAADDIAQRTDDRVSLRFYPGGTMGGDQAVLRKIRIGQLHGGVFLAGGLAEVEPNFEIYNLPLIFNSYDEVDFVRERVDTALIERLADNGLVAFGLTETGFTYLLSAKATRTFEDLKGRKAWIPQGDQVSMAIVDAAGLSPVPLPISDVLTGLQTGLIDSAAAPPVAALALQWFTKAPYLTDLPITYVFGALAISTKAFERLSDGDQQIVRDELSAAVARLDKRTRTDNLEAMDALADQGVTLVDPTDEARSRWSEIAAEARARLIAERGFDPKLVAEVERLLAEYRARSTSDGE
jgi:TRAP-type C4-dicarboxylate transport system substrate-binding protein